MPFTAKLYDDVFADKPLSREKTRLQARAAPIGVHAHHIVVHNLSSQGLLVESHDELQVGSDILFDIPDLGRHLARITWREGLFYDCTFASPLPAEKVRAKLTSAKVVWAPFGGARPAELIEFARYQDALAQGPAIEFPPGLSLRARLALILAAALLCWLVPIGLFLWLR